MLALLRMDLINFSMRGPKEPVRLSDLLPREAECEVAASALRRMSAKRRRAVADKIRAVMGSFLG